MIEMTLDHIGSTMKGCQPNHDRRCSECAEGFPEGTKKEKGQEGEGEGDVILLMTDAP